MKSHDFAKHLTLMAKILKSGPNIEMEDLSLSETTSLKVDSKNIERSDVPKALNMLVNLNEMKKSEWLDLIENFDFDIDVRPRDATRDVIGKLLSYLSENQDEREKLIGKKVKKRDSVSLELADALSLLLS